jgi:hypothetical protein
MTAGTCDDRRTCDERPPPASTPAETALLLGLVARDAGHAKRAPAGGMRRSSPGSRWRARVRLDAFDAGDVRGMPRSSPGSR